MLEWFLTINRGEIGRRFMSRHKEEVAAVNNDWKIKRPNAALRAATMIIVVTGTLPNTMSKSAKLGSSWSLVGPR